MLVTRRAAYPTLPYNANAFVFFSIKKGQEPKPQPQKFTVSNLTRQTAPARYDQVLYMDLQIHNLTHQILPCE
jgi:hypothetical protein